MKRQISIISLVAGLLAFMPVYADSLDNLLEEVRTGSLEKTDAARELEQRFAAAADAEKASIVSALRSERASLEGRSDGLERTFAAGEDELNALRLNREQALGDLNELFSNLQQIAGETEATFETSVISAQFPGRGEQLAAISTKLNQSNDLVTAAEIESVWTAMLNEMVQQGKVVTFNTPVATASGSKEEQAVTRVGVFNLVGDGKFMTYGKGGVAELPRQPAGQFLGSVGDLQEARIGNRGTVLCGSHPRHPAGRQC